MRKCVYHYHSEMMMIAAMEDVEKGLREREVLQKDVKFVDDQGMVTQREKGLQTKMGALSKTVKEYDI